MNARRRIFPYSESRRRDEPVLACEIGKYFHPNSSVHLASVSDGTLKTVSKRIDGGDRKCLPEYSFRFQQPEAIVGFKGARKSRRQPNSRGGDPGHHPRYAALQDEEVQPALDPHKSASHETAAVVWVSSGSVCQLQIRRPSAALNSNNVVCGREAPTPPRCDFFVRVSVSGAKRVSRE